MSTTTLLVRQGRLDETRLLEAADTRIAASQVRVRVDTFALTSNNITYAAFGEAMNYWRFFPAAEDGWGVVPVWGFGTVVQSLHAGVTAGERLYGYWPMADHAILEPARLTAGGFSDAAPHRRELHAVYNQYLRCNADPFYTAQSEDAQALLRPLFITSWLIDDFLADNAFFGADTILLSSASSKTAYGTAHLLSQRPGLQVVGLTSPRNKAFCERLGCYSQILGYEQTDRLPAGTAAVYVDFAGNAGLRRDIHSRFSNLKYSCSVGGTHVEQLGGGRDLQGPRPVLFFAPAQVKKRNVDWGTAALGARLVEGWAKFLDTVSERQAPWLTVEHHHGADAVLSAYAQVLAGQGDPARGHILSLSRS